IVDAQSDPAGGGEVGIAQGQSERMEGGEVEADLALYEAAGGDAAGGGHAGDDGGGVALGGEAVDRHRTLGDGVDLAIGGKGRGNEKGAALQAVRVAEGGDVDVDAAALRREGRQIGGDHDGGDTGRAHILAARVHPEP